MQAGTVSEAASVASASARKPRILALHGYRTSAQARADVVYLDSPTPATGPPYPDVKQFFTPPFYEWWDAVEDPVTSTFEYRGCESSIAFLAEHIRKNGPFDGWMGFSQGGSLLATVLLLQQQGKLQQDITPPAFCILIASSPNRDPRYTPLFQPGSITTPCCLMMGDTDTQQARVEGLVGCCSGPLVLRHARGHLVPRLDDRQQELLGQFMLGSHAVLPHLHPSAPS
ncbi:MAG: hypothetical protein WDW38_006875 [Sanguina aurantia]